MIVFNTLKIHGFAGQVSFLAFKLDQPGLNIITGPNGANKSTIFNALSWVLYGTTLKEKASVETWEHKQPEDYKGTMVALSFFKGTTRYKITRCLKYKDQVGGLMGRNRLIFEKDGEPVKVGDSVLKDKRDIQKSITEVLGMSYKLFINTVIFPQRITRFIEESGAEKKKILEESFNLQWLNQAVVNVKVKLDKAETAVSSQREKVSSIEASIEEKDDLLDKIEDARDKFEDEKEEALEEIRKQIASLEESTKATMESKNFDYMTKREYKYQAKLDLLQKDPLITSKDKVKEKIDDLLKKKAKALAQVDFAKKHIAAAKDGVCDSCGQVLKGKTAKEHRQKYTKIKVEWDPILADCNFQLPPLETDYLAAKEVETEIKDTETTLKDIRKSLREGQEARLKRERDKGRLSELRVKEKEEDKKEFNDVSGPIKRAKYEAEKKLAKAHKEYKRLKRSRDQYLWLLKVPLSNSGIKAYLFDHLLETLNDAVAYYERYTELGIRLEINMEGARKDINTIVTKEGYPVAYQDLSGGETQSVNVTVALASGDVLTQDNPTNLQVMDEVFEGLDNANIDMVGNLLMDKAQDKALFVITHNDAFNPRNANFIRIGDEETD